MSDSQGLEALGNRCDPASILPPELLTAILLLVCDGRPDTICKLALVSCVWRSFVSEEPQLWTRIIIDDHLYRLGGSASDDLQSRRERTIRFVKCCISRSKSALLDITLDWNADDYESPVSDQVTAKEIILQLMGENREHSKRWRSLTWLEDGGNVITLWDFVGLLPPVMPNLRRIRLFGLTWKPRDEERWSNKTTPVFPHCPALWSLELVRFEGRHLQDSFLSQIDYSSISALTYEAAHRWMLHDLARLNSFYALQTLTIRTGWSFGILEGGRMVPETRHPQVEGISDPSKLPTIQLPNLRTLCLSLRDRPHMSILVLSLLRSPRLENLTFRLCGRTKRQYSSELSKFADYACDLLRQVNTIRLDTYYQPCQNLESDLVYFLERACSLRELRLCPALAALVGRRLEDEIKHAGWKFSLCIS